MVKKKRKVLHIAPHLGGGVGRFFVNTLKLDTRSSHEFLLLEYPHNSNFLDSCAICWRVWGGPNDCLKNYTEDCDLIEIDFWNHPALLLFLVHHEIEGLPVVLYSFVAGNAPPNLIPSEIIEYVDWVILPGPSSLENTELTNRLHSYSVVFALGGISRTEDIQRMPHANITVSYVGTAGNEKLHSDFIWACKMISDKFPSTQFRFASNDSNEHLQREAFRFDILEKFEFFTAMDDLDEFYSTSDIFGYPLGPDHYGTGEQALLEAMGAGVPPVVLGNSAERQLVHDGQTGLIASDIFEYVELVCFLISENSFRKTLADNARLYAKEHFSARQTIAKLNEVYDVVEGIPPRIHKFEMQSRASFDLGWELFTLGVGKNSPAVLSLTSKTEAERKYWSLRSSRLKYLFSNVKGGLGHYLKYFPNDLNLNALLKKMAG
jgi:L-malate glycosyltransferase